MAETPPDRPRLRDLLEPEALLPGFPKDERNAAWDAEIQASQAISLKRIADFLDGDALNYNSIIDLFWQAGQAFERGKGTA